MNFMMLLLLGVMVLTPVWADPGPSEEDTLRHLTVQLNTLTPLLDQAEIHAAAEVRTTRYACLRGDLDQVRSGIETHLDNARLQPLKPSALCLDYLSHSALPGVRLAAAERDALARLAHALAALDPLIAVAENAAAQDMQVVFQYPWLRRDLHGIHNALIRLITAPTTVPRAVAPLAGDHRR